MTKSIALLTIAGIMAAGLVSIATWADDIGPQLKADEIIKALVGPKLTGVSGDKITDKRHSASLATQAGGAATAEIS